MEPYGMDILKNATLFSALIQCGGSVYTWCYNADGTLLKSNCPDEALLSGVFSVFGCVQRMVEYGREHATPITLGTALGMMWDAAIEKDGDT